MMCPLDLMGVHHTGDQRQHFAGSVTSAILLNMSPDRSDIVEFVRC